MRAVIQRVSKASITIDGVSGSSMGGGMVILLGIERGDEISDIDWLVKKCVELRVFEDEDGKMNESILSTGGEVMVVSQFTLFGNVKKGNRPSFNRSAHPEDAIPLYESFVSGIKACIGDSKVSTGKFAAYMEVSLVNDGPVTILLDSKNKNL